MTKGIYDLDFVARIARFYLWYSHVCVAGRIRFGACLLNILVVWR